MEAGAISRTLGEALAGGGHPPAPPAAAIHPAAALSSISAAARAAAGNKYRVPRKRPLSSLNAATSKADQAEGPSGD